MEERVRDLLEQGRKFYEKKDYAKAEPLLEQVAACESRFADVFDMLGVIAHLRSDFTTAEQRFEQAITINPNYTEALLNLAITYNERQKYAEAREIFTKLKHQAPRQSAEIEPFAKGKLANMHAELAQAYSDLGLIAEAIRELEQALALAPTFSDLRTQLGILLRDNGDLIRASQEFSAAVGSNPRFFKAHLLLGCTRLALNDREGAVQSWKRALAIEPENQRALSYLAMVEESPPSK
jgi:tetratricopeptide (TPR) repeat protein